MLASFKPYQDISRTGRAALRMREGDRLVAYRDSVGVLTISVGVTTASGLITVTPGLTITQAQSDALFATAVEKYVAPVRVALSREVPQEFFDACCSLAYNIGPVAFTHSSVVRLANAGNLPAAIEAFLMWNKPAAIISRRQAERDQAATPYDKSLPRARRSDKVTVEEPPPLAAIPKAPATASKASAPSQPALTGGLSSAPTPAPGFWSRVHALLSRPKAA
ncbi:lysozyme [Methylobacterium sp. E-025]|uniref:lysozyme n=1 Tax=Methylobacterium sp. E-025 TaxID=2836561 RepID=UPI001FB9789C|nr:lysozyme [Methylobacterium sp. E-025]MCJ2112979.1 lysozyme [Methylobacterium sp. E-025]